MQCFTRPSLYPRTVHLRTYTTPPSSSYDQPLPFNPEPDHNGRMNNPDAFRIPRPFEQFRLLYNPVNDSHRRRKLPQMLHYINQVNFTTSRDARVQSPTQRVPYTEYFRHSERMPTTTASTYVNPGRVKVVRRVSREHEEAAVGIVPMAYRYVP